MVQEVTIGREDFASLIEADFLYIDKTKYLSEFLAVNDARVTDAARNKVMLFTRPRRFGKTLTMSMIENFFQLDYQNPGDTSKAEKIFKGLLISDNQEFCKLHMAKYPVISISLKDIEGLNFVGAMAALFSALNKLYDRFAFLLEKTELSVSLRENFKKILNTVSLPQFRPWFTADPEGACALVKGSLAVLTTCLEEAFGQKVIVLIDEYDVPLQKARVKGYYNEMLDVIRGMFSQVFKSNSSLLLGVVTGCLRISHESIFTGINNFSVYSVFDERYRDFIGFSENDVRDLLNRQGLSACETTVMNWYDGYNFAGMPMLCPWSVLNFCAKASLSKSGDKVRPENFWINSSGNDIIEICMKQSSENDSERLQNLLNGHTEIIRFPEYTSYPEINQNSGFDLMAGMMLHTGYLTAISSYRHDDHNKNDDSGIDGNSPDDYDDYDDYDEEIHLIEVKIPNKEVLSCFRHKADLVFGSSNPQWVSQAGKLKDALFSGQKTIVQDALNEMLTNYVSVRDAGSEAFYHGFVLGALSAVVNGRDISSNTESGQGYPDITIKNDKTRKAVVLELKRADVKDTPADVDDLVTAALAQIEEKNYAYSLKRNGYKEVFCYALVFKSKSCAVALRSDGAGN